MALYNPADAYRERNLEKAQDILLHYFYHAERKLEAQNKIKWEVYKAYTKPEWQASHVTSMLNESNNFYRQVKKALKEAMGGKLPSAMVSYRWFAGVVEAQADKFKLEL